MSKFYLFLIFTLVVQQNTYEVLSLNQMIDAITDATDLEKSCEETYNIIDSEIYLYHISEIETIMEAFDITQAYNELNETINETYITVKPGSKAIKCITQARNAADAAMMENLNATSNCSLEPMLVTNTIKTELESVMIEVDDLHDEVSGKYMECLRIDDPTEILIIKCLREITDLEKKLGAIFIKFVEQYEEQRATEEKNLADLRKCLEQIEDFSTISKDISETLGKCVKINSATNTYSENIFFFCLCLLCVLRMM